MSERLQVPVRSLRQEGIEVNDFYSSSQLTSLMIVCKSPGEKTKKEPQKNPVFLPELFN